MQIKSVTGRELWSSDHDTMRDTVIAAVEADAYLTDANLARANLAGANLAGANLARAYLADANLARAYLADANLADADLADAYLADANLTRANLAGANLAGANLADAYLADANLAGANLAGAKLRQGILIERQPLQISGLRWRVTIWDAHMQIGCEFHGLTDWWSYDDRRINRMDSNALRFWNAHKSAIFALAASDGRWVEPATEAEAAE